MTRILAWFAAVAVGVAVPTAPAWADNLKVEITNETELNLDVAVKSQYIDALSSRKLAPGDTITMDLVHSDINGSSKGVGSVVLYGHKGTEQCRITLAMEYQYDSRDSSCNEVSLKSNSSSAICSEGSKKTSGCSLKFDIVSSDSSAVE